MENIRYRGGLALKNQNKILVVPWLNLKKVK
jgi:hypothetical protein